MPRSMLRLQPSMTLSSITTVLDKNEPVCDTPRKAFCSGGKRWILKKFLIGLCPLRRSVPALMICSPAANRVGRPASICAACWPTWSARRPGSWPRWSRIALYWLLSISVLKKEKDLKRKIRQESFLGNITSLHSCPLALLFCRLVSRYMEEHPKTACRGVSTNAVSNVGESQDFHRTISTYSQKSPVFVSSSLKISDILQFRTS